jgi:hypothetical protein
MAYCKLWLRPAEALQLCWQEAFANAPDHSFLNKGLSCFGRVQGKRWLLRRPLASEAPIQRTNAAPNAALAALRLKALAAARPEAAYPKEAPAIAAPRRSGKKQRVSYCAPKAENRLRLRRPANPFLWGGAKRRKARRAI